MFTDEKQTEFIDNVFKSLVKMLQSSKVSGNGRDSAMELIIKNMLRSDGVQRTKKFLDTDGKQYIPELNNFLYWYAWIRTEILFRTKL